MEIILEQIQALAEATTGIIVTDEQAYYAASVTVSVEDAVRVAVGME